MTQTGCLKQQTFLRSGDGESKIKVLSGLVSDEGFLLGFQTAAFSLCVHVGEGKRASAVVSFLLIRALIPS